MTHTHSLHQLHMASAPPTIVITMPFEVDDEGRFRKDEVKVLVEPFPCWLEVPVRAREADGTIVVAVPEKAAERGVRRELLQWTALNLMKAPRSYEDLPKKCQNSESAEEMVRILHGWNLWTDDMEALVKRRLRDEWAAREEELYGHRVTNVSYMIAAAKKAAGIRGYEVDGMEDLRKEEDVILARLVEHSACALDMEGPGAVVRVEMEEVPMPEMSAGDQERVWEPAWELDKRIRKAAREGAGTVTLVLTDLQGDEDEDLARYVWAVMNSEDVGETPSKRRKLDAKDGLRCRHHVTVIVDASNYQDVDDACVA